MNLLSKFGIIVSELFQVSLVTYLILLLIETIDPGFVSNVFNLNYLLILVLVSGVLKVLPLSEKKYFDQWDLIDLGLEKWINKLKPKGLSENDFYFILLVGFGGGILVYYKTQDLGQISIIISVITTIIIFLMSYLIFSEPEN